jgi:hypothetical protein
MVKRFFVLALFLHAQLVLGQTTRVDGLISNGAVSVGSKAQANSSAILDAHSTTKGFLPPRMTTAQRDAIATPATGLTIFNTTTNKVNVYDGSIWGEVGGGGGGIYTPGINLIENNSWEADATGWTASGGTYARVTAAANIVPPGIGAGSWDPSATAQTLTGDAITITANDGLSGANGVLSCNVKTAAVDLKMEVFDGTNVISPNAATDVVPASSSGFIRYTVNFIFPASGTVSPRFRSQSDSAIAYIDDCYMGRADNYNLFEVSQASFIGSAYIAGTTNCQWSRTNTAFGAFPVDTDCPGVTVELNPGPGVIQTTDTDLPRFTVNNLPPGTYQVIISGFGGNSAGGGASFAIFDGTTTTGYGSGNSSSGAVSQFTTIGTFTYTTAGDRTFEIYGAASSNAVILYNLIAAYRLSFSIYRYPLQSQLAVRPDQSNFGWTPYTPGTQGFGTTTSQNCLNKRDGDSLWIRCRFVTGTTTASEARVNLPGTLVSAGADRLPDVAMFDDTFRSDSASNLTKVGIAANTGYVTFYNAGSTTAQNGNNIVGNSATFAFVAGPIPIAGWTENQNAPQLVNSVVSGFDGVFRQINAEINCDASSAITLQSGGIASVGNRSTASCALTLMTGFFSATPYTCNVTTKAAAVQATACSCSSATSCTIYGASADYDAYVYIAGPR